jgi:hypothetical protein
MQWVQLVQNKKYSFVVDVVHLVVIINENINPKCTEWTTVKVYGSFVVN